MAAPSTQLDQDIWELFLNLSFRNCPRYSLYLTEYWILEILPFKYLYCLFCRLGSLRLSSGFLPLNTILHTSTRMLFLIWKSDHLISGKFLFLVAPCCQLVTHGICIFFLWSGFQFSVQPQLASLPSWLTQAIFQASLALRCPWLWAWNISPTWWIPKHP